jgi:hypothetical protein
MNAFELDFILQMAEVKPNCRGNDGGCGHGLEDHDLDDPEGPCKLCGCPAYLPMLCSGEIGFGPCSKVLDHIRRSVI